MRLRIPDYSRSRKKNESASQRWLWVASDQTRFAKFAQSPFKALLEFHRKQINNNNNNKSTFVADVLCIAYSAAWIVGFRKRQRSHLSDRELRDYAAPAVARATLPTIHLSHRKLADTSKLWACLLHQMSEREIERDRQSEIICLFLLLLFFVSHISFLNY